MTAKQLASKQKALRSAVKEAAGRVGKHLANEAARASAAAYLEALLGGATRKNGWQLAEAAGLATPYRFQHLLGRAVWEADALRDDHLQHVLGALGQREAVLAIEETGFVKQGKKSVGVARQYCGASGKIDHCQVGVFLSWQTAKGHALLDRALYLPKEWAQDKERRRAAGIPENIAFAATPELARALAERALSAGARPAWVVADAVYGSDSKLRFFLEERGQPYVLAVTGAQTISVALRQHRVKSLVGQAPADAWARINVGAGAKGARVFDWAARPINHPYDPRRWRRWLLARRSVGKPTEITCYLAFAPVHATLGDLARAAGRRWAIAESFAQAKGEVGLAHYEVRSWAGWHRHVTLAMVAQALLAATRARLFAPSPAAVGEKSPVGVVGALPPLAAFRRSRGLAPAGRGS